MLQSIRDRTHGWIAGIVISILILSFALWGISSYFLGGAANNVVAKVNGIDITKSQLASAYERLRKQLQMQYSSNYEIPMQAESEIKNRALQALIDIQVLRQASIAHSYRVSSRQIDNFLESMPEFQVDGQFSYARLQQILATTLINSTDFLELIKTTLLIDQPRLGIIFTSYPLSKEVADAIALINQARDIQYAVIPLQSSQGISISDEKIQEYYQQHQADFKTPEQVNIEYVELSLNDLIKTSRPTDEAIKNFYNENINSFALPAQWKLESLTVPLKENASTQEVQQATQEMQEIIEKAKKGSRFDALIKEYSLKEDKNENLKQGVMLNQVSPELQKALLTLTKPQQLSVPVRTRQGITLLKVIAVTEPQVQSFEKVRDKVKDSLMRQQAEEKFANAKEKLSNISYEHPDSLQPAASALNLPIKTSQFFTKEKGNAGISTHNKIREAAFSNDVLNLQNNSDVIPIGSDTLVVLRVKSHQPTTLLSLKMVKNQIVDKLTANEVDIKSAKLTDEIRQKLQAGANPDEVATQYHFAWIQTGLIGRHSTKINSAILDTAFTLPQPKTGIISYGTVKTAPGYAIIGVRTVKEGSPAQVNNVDVFAEQIQNSQGVMEYELYKQSLMKQAKIVVEN